MWWEHRKSSTPRDQKNKTEKRTCKSLCLRTSITEAPERFGQGGEPSVVYQSLELETWYKGVRLDRRQEPGYARNIVSLSSRTPQHAKAKNTSGNSQSPRESARDRLMYAYIYIHSSTSYHFRCVCARRCRRDDCARFASFFLRAPFFTCC